MIWSPRPNMPTTAPEGNLQGVRSLPIVLPVPNKVVYSVHEYPVSVCDMKVNRSAATLVPHMNRVWGYLINENIAPVWIGEMGSSLQTEIDRHWAQTMLAYVNGDLADRGGPRFSGSQQGISWDWWNWGHLDGWVPDGILAQWTGEPRQDQYAIVERMLMRRNQVDQAAITHP